MLVSLSCRYADAQLANQNWNFNGTSTRWDVLDNEIAAETVVDARFSYRFDTSGGGVNLFVNLNNLLDEDPEENLARVQLQLFHRHRPCVDGRESGSPRLARSKRGLRPVGAVTGSRALPARRAFEDGPSRSRRAARANTSSRLLTAMFGMPL